MDVFFLRSRGAGQAFWRDDDGRQIDLTVIRSGRLKALAVAGDDRLPAYLDIPTFAESGVVGMDAIAGWLGFDAPANTPKSIVRKIGAAVAVRLVGSGRVHDAPSGHARAELYRLRVAAGLDAGPPCRFTDGDQRRHRG